ncbi:7SK snRNA methylphosphate capping enzyme-like [Dermacentor variabilis]|uniref:7SK snRNA methylphosphate capping enzyme-like n=1 Tax=Dermacentor variabilis TaxID=34621 RepID=UPI003F5BA6DB
METAVAVPGIHVDMSSKRGSTAVFQRTICRSASVDNRPKTLKPANGAAAESGGLRKPAAAREEPASNQNKPPAPSGKGTFGKRRQSFGSLAEHKHLFKRRRRDLFTPPTKFLLGGNINDPLNLASFENDEVNKRANAVTPKSSPVPTPRHRTQVEVLIPPNINDPLNLNTGEDIEFKLISPGSRRRKRRYKRKSRSEDDSGTADGSNATPAATAAADAAADASATASSAAGDLVDAPASAADAAAPAAASTTTPSPAVTAATPTTSRKTSGSATGPLGSSAASASSSSSAAPCPADKIVSPVVPQGSPVKFSRRKSSAESRRSTGSGAAAAAASSRPATSAKQVHFRPKDAHFQYGNYNRYYGYRNGGGQEDPRLKAMKKEWFCGLDVLDIGCNVGHLTLSLARDYAPRKVIGLDIDGGLIRAARRNVRHYLTAALAGEMRFPVSMAICHGPIAAAALPGRQAESVAFPNNVFFVEGNYILDSDSQLEAQQEEFDMILCLSLTKWVHLNWGDDGVRFLFKRMHRQLRPGGRMLLEAQPFHSYAKKKKLTETTYKHFHAITLRPEQFNEYLLSPEVGFAKCELVATPSHASKGFQRPLYLFTKAGSLDESQSQPRNDATASSNNNNNNTSCASNRMEASGM